MSEPIRWTLGDTWRLSFTTNDVAGDPVTATACNLCIKRIGGSSTLELDLDDTEITAASGSVSVVILPAVTETLTAGRYSIDFKYVANGHTESLRAPLSAVIRDFCEG